MTTEELNPDHPVTAALREQWHKVAALIMQKLGVERVVITADDIAALARSGKGHIAALDGSDALVILLVSHAEGERLAREKSASWP